MRDDSIEAPSRRRALVLSWVAYATYYLGRKAFSATKVAVVRDLRFDASVLGLMDTVNLAAYAFGQFVSGTVGDRIGSRRLVGLGMLLSALSCAAFGASSAVFALGAFYFVTGLAQSTGWPGTTRVVAEWTEPKRRATVMGRWATCYQVGGFVATPLAGFLAAHYGWRVAMFVPAVVMALVGSVVLVRLPSPVVAPAFDASHEPVERAQLAVLKNVALWLYGTSYFFIKLVRYALMLWLPYYLAMSERYDVEHSAYVASAFDAGGVLGVILIGRIADRTRRFSKPGLSALWIALLVPVFFAYSLTSGSVLTDVLVLALLGALLFGPDSLLSGADAQDLGGSSAPATAVGLVNGLGSVGAVVQGLFVPMLIKDHDGWGALFRALALFSLGAVLPLLAVLVWRRRAVSAGAPS